MRIKLVKEKLIEKLEEIRPYLKYMLRLIKVFYCLSIYNR